MSSILSKRKIVRSRRSIRKTISFKKNLVKEFIIPRRGKSRPVNGRERKLKRKLNRVSKRKLNRVSKRKIIIRILNKDIK
jgi:hypothetical protein